MARYIRLTANSWSLVGLEQFGLAEVRFFYVPVEARAPQSANNAKDVSVDATLDWRPGRDERTYPTGSGLSFAPGGAPCQGALCFPPLKRWARIDRPEGTKEDDPLQGSHGFSIHRQFLGTLRL